MHLDDARLFATLAHAPSLSAAARALARSTSAVSAALQRLEGRLGATLVNRTTRAMELTPEGEQFLETCETLLQVWSTGERALHEARDRLAGTLRVAAPVDLAHQHLAGWCATFTDAHPDVRLTLMVDDRFHPLPRDGVDVAFRFGALDDSTLVATRLCEVPRRVVATAEHLARHGQPAHPRDLTDHPTLAWMQRGRARDAWTLRRGDEHVTVAVRPHLVGDGALVRGWALAGRGVAFKSHLDVVEDLRAGRLVDALPGWEGDPVPLMALIPAGRRRPLRVERLVAHVRDRVHALLDGVDTP